MNDEAFLRTWNIYQSAWAPIDYDKRREILSASVEDEIVYTDPGSQTYGVAALAERIAKSQERFPGAYFRDEDFVEHHGQALFQWTMLTREGKEAVNGTSFARFGESGRLVQASGFFEAPKKSRLD